MSTSFELAGKIQAKLPEKTSFSQTCTLLRQFLKENRAALGDLSHTGKPEIFRQIATPMSLFPENPVAESAPKNQPAQTLKPMDVLPQLVDSSAKMVDATEVPKTDQMTIFYAGKVISFNDFPAEKAKEIMLLASKASSNSQVVTPQPAFAPAPKIPNNQIESNLRIPPCPIMGTTNLIQVPGPVEPNSDLPIARRNSLHRFLEKRKDRIISRAPYPAVPTSSASSGQAEKKSWLSLAASQ